ncbi:MAG: hypothetical protein J7521_17445 [Caulobacter sp.]|nr:hypothetical protein [Caulobacter sp.]
MRFDANTAHPDVIDAMLRQPHGDSVRPFRVHQVGAKGGIVAAADYDLGPIRAAYFDKDAANYHVSTGGQRTSWNNGRTWRNDGVDIAREADGVPYVQDFTDGEWLRYAIQVETAGEYDLSLSARASGAGASVSAEIAGAGVTPLVAVPSGAAWSTIKMGGLALHEGRNSLVLRSNGAAADVKTLSIRPR